MTNRSFFTFLLAFAVALSGCQLVVDFDRDRIDGGDDDDDDVDGGDDDDDDDDDTDGGEDAGDGGEDAGDGGEDAGDGGEDAGDGGEDAGDAGDGGEDAGDAGDGGEDAGDLCDGVDCSGMDSVCTIGVCNPSTGACGTMPTNEDGACDDGMFCTQGETCNAGVCNGGSARTCPSGMCTTGVCNEATNMCDSAPANEDDACDDGLFCTDGETCNAGVCNGGTAHSCSGLNGMCTVGSCNEAMNMCVALPANEDDPCDDGLFCTDNSTCNVGVCNGGTPHVCPSNQCNSGVCDETTNSCGLSPTNEGDPCDDSLFCTQNESCNAGACDGGTPRSCAPTVAEREMCLVGYCDETMNSCETSALGEALLQLGFETGTLGTDEARLRNASATREVQLNGYLLCTDANDLACTQVGAADGRVAAGGTTTLTLNAIFTPIAAASGQLAIYGGTNQSTGTLCDYVQWGVGGQSLEAAAVTASEWTAADFVDVTGISSGESIKWSPGVTSDNDTGAAWSIDPTF